MKNVCVLLFLIVTSCQLHQKEKYTSKEIITQSNIKSKNELDDLFKLNIIHEENFVRITNPKNTDFTLPDSAAKTEPHKIEDFNADNKNDVMVYLGACGTGGCMYGVFLNQYENYYKLVFMDYLKNTQFEKEKNGHISINSYEEFEPYNPSKLSVTKFKFNETKYQYTKDTTYIMVNK